MKICTECNEEKPFDQFYVQRQGKTCTIYKSKCIDCQKNLDLERYHKVPLEEQRRRRKIRRENVGERRWKDYRFKTRYGISVDEYERLYSEQEGKCFICSTEHDILRVDHDHKTGNVRKLLCHHCNTGLGLFREDVELLYKAISYIGGTC